MTEPGKGRTRRKRTPREILEAAAPDAARVIAAAVTDGELTQKERYSAACEVLGRLYGKSMEDRPDQEPPQELRVVFEGESGEFGE